MFLNPFEIKRGRALAKSLAEPRPLSFYFQACFEPEQKRGQNYLFVKPLSRARHF